MDLSYRLATVIGQLTADFQSYATGNESNTQLIRQCLADANMALSTGKDASVPPMLLQALGQVPPAHPCRARLYRIYAAMQSLRAAEAAIAVAEQP